MRVWLNGALVAAAEARVDPADRGLLLGDGVFETLRVAEGRIAHLGRHLARLRGAAAFFAMGCPEAATLAGGLEALREAEALVEGSLRLTLTRGPGPRGVLPPATARPTVLITAAHGLPAAADGLRLCVARSTRRNAFSPTARFKTLNYLDGIVARREAQQLGCDDALLRNTEGRLAEATAANLLWRDRDGAWFTPPVGDGALPGIRRAVLVERGLVAERGLDDPAAITSAMLCSSLAVREVATLGARALAPDAAALARFREASDQS